MYGFITLKSTDKATENEIMFNIKHDPPWCCIWEFIVCFVLFWFVLLCFCCFVSCCFMFCFVLFFYFFVWFGFFVLFCFLFFVSCFCFVLFVSLGFFLINWFCLKLFWISQEFLKYICMKAKIFFQNLCVILTKTTTTATNKQTHLLTALFHLQSSHMIYYICSTVPQIYASHFKNVCSSYAEIWIIWLMPSLSIIEASDL